MTGAVVPEASQVTEEASWQSRQLAKCTGVMFVVTK